MIRIFSTVRRGLLQDNRFTRYLLYAAGEIALVVIGILIALQVNNWNEARSAHAFESVMLQEIRENVRVNLERFRALERRLQTSDAGIQLWLAESAKPDPDPERLARHFDVLSSGIVFSFNRGAYDSLKDSGLDRLSNRALRSELVDHFDSFLPRYERFVQLEFDWLQEEGRTATFGLQQPVVARSDNGQLRIDMRFPGGLDWSRREIQTLVSLQSQANAVGHLRLQRVIAETETLLASLDAEIDGTPTATRAGVTPAGTARPKSTAN